VRFPISYSPGKGLILRSVGLARRWAYVEVGADVVKVRMGWAFRAAIARRAIRSARHRNNVMLTAGVHGWRGRWLVNGAKGAIVAITIDPPARAYVLGFPIRLREVWVSVDDPAELVAALIPADSR
jgi:hypothetical protein